MLKRLQIETILVTGLMVSVGAFAFTQAYNIHQHQAGNETGSVNEVMKVADSSS